MLETHRAQDPVLQTLQASISRGWPEYKQHIGQSVQPFWTYKEEPTIDKGLIFEGNRVLIPAVLCSEFLAKIHTGHSGIEASLRKTCGTVFWRDMTKDISNFISSCSTCNSVQRRQQKETLIPHQVPRIPWSKVGMDLFSLNKSTYLIMVDYYSDYCELEELRDYTASTVIDCCKRQFSRHGTPHNVFNDNGPPISGMDFQLFAKDRDFRHGTSSPYHSQSMEK